MSSDHAATRARPSVGCEGWEGEGGEEREDGMMEEGAPVRRAEQPVSPAAV